MSTRKLFTSESVSEGHPDKMADQISDAVVDAILAKDPKSRVAAETMIKTGFLSSWPAKSRPMPGSISKNWLARSRAAISATTTSVNGIRRQNLRRPECDWQAIAGHRTGRRPWQRPACAGRRRPGHDVRLRNERNRRADAGGDHLSHRLVARRRRSASPARCHGCGPMPRARSRSSTKTANRSASTRSCCRPSTRRTCRTKTCATASWIAFIKPDLPASGSASGPKISHQPDRPFRNRRARRAIAA